MGRYKQSLTPEECAEKYKDTVVEEAVASAIWIAPQTIAGCAEYAVRALRAWDRLNGRTKFLRKQKKKRKLKV
jgi:hypothetical protein